jgi:cellulase/cellobiase CelA1
MGQQTIRGGDLGLSVRRAVTNTGYTAISAWTVGFAFAGTQIIANSWNAAVTQTGAQVTAANETYNGMLVPGSSTTWGFVANGTNQPPVNPTCT